MPWVYSNYNYKHTQHYERNDLLHLDTEMITVVIKYNSSSLDLETASSPYSLQHYIEQKN